MSDGLDLVEQLLNNESKSKPKKDDLYVEPRSILKLPSETKYVTPEEYEKLGSPTFGYTTARIRKFGKERNAEFYSVLMEYYRAAIKYVKLTKVIGWYEIVDERKLNLCRKELEEFRVENGLTKGDIGEIVDISYRYEYNRKKLTTRLIEVATIAAKLDGKKVNFKEFAKVPANVRPKLKYVEDVVNDDESEPTEEKSVHDILQEVIKVGPKACAAHPNYRGLRMPRNGCDKCKSFYDYNKSKGIKEERNG